jgi:hypothetical protein
MTVTGGTVEKLPVVIFMKLFSFLEEASRKVLEFLPGKYSKIKLEFSLKA